MSIIVLSNDFNLLDKLANHNFNHELSEEISDRGFRKLILFLCSMLKVLALVLSEQLFNIVISQDAHTIDQLIVD